MSEEPKRPGQPALHRSSMRRGASRLAGQRLAAVSALGASISIASGNEAGLVLMLERAQHEGSHVHIRLVNQGRRPVRVFLGGDPFGPTPFGFVVDRHDTEVPVAAEHRHDRKPVLRMLAPGKHYLVDLGPDRQFLGHSLTAVYKVEPTDCSGCWTGKVASAPLELPAQ